MYYYVYITTNKINGKKYIGQHTTENIEDSYLGSGKTLLKAIKKYGKENFEKEILEFANDKDHLSELEKKYIEIFNAVNDSNFYNISAGGEGYSGHTWSEEHKLYISNKLKELYATGKKVPVKQEWSVDRRKRHSKLIKHEYETGKRTSPMKGKTGNQNPLYGKCLSEEQKQKMSQRRKELIKSGELSIDHLQTKESKRKMAETRKKKYANGEYEIRDITGDKNPMYGKKGVLHPVYGTHKTEEQKQELSKICKEQYKNGRVPTRKGKKWDKESKDKMSKSHKGLIDGHKNPNYGKGRQTGKSVRCIERDIIYPSIAKAAKDNNCWPHQILSCLKGERDSVNNLHWEYASQANTVPSIQKYE